MLAKVWRSVQTTGHGVPLHPYKQHLEVNIYRVFAIDIKDIMTLRNSVGKLLSKCRVLHTATYFNLKVSKQYVMGFYIILLD